MKKNVGINFKPDHRITDCRAVFIAGPTASGKSQLAIRIAETFGGIIINADSMQVYGCWQVLTARPSLRDEKRIPHFLYGHVGRNDLYSVGKWQHEITQLLSDNLHRLPIIVGGTGLYFDVLSKGLVAIPPIDPELRRQGQQLLASKGLPFLTGWLQKADPQTMQRLDMNNPARLLRAWEVLQATGKGLHAWHQEPTSTPLLPPSHVYSILLNPEREANAVRIDQRIHWMIRNNVLEECARALVDWNPELPSSKALGAREFIAFLQGRMELTKAIEQVLVFTRQYAKRQRTWFRNRMSNWSEVISDSP